MKGIVAAVAALAAAVITPMAAAQEPMAIAKQGSFAAGGKVIGEADKSTLHCDHGFVEYQIPANPRRVSLLMWHSSSAAVWQNRWDGGEGFQSLFLRQGYPVYLWDGPRVGRANWGCEEYASTAGSGRDQQNFTAWRFGPSWMEWFPGIQFPKDDARAFEQAMRARYDEFDRVPNVHLQADAAVAALERVGPSVLLTNSAGGLRALLTAIRSPNVKAIVAYENPGFVFPQGEENRPDGPFGPIHVSRAEFLALTKIPLQFVWGDNIDKSATWVASFEQCRRFVELVNANGGQAEILYLPDRGLHGNTHIPFADLNNIQVAGLLAEFLAKNGLDSR